MLISGRARGVRVVTEQRKVHPSSDADYPPGGDGDTTAMVSVPASPRRTNMRWESMIGVSNQADFP
jgi:hypothetical protein